MKTNLKKLISLLLAVIMIVAAVPVMSFAAKTSGKLTYEINNGEVTITDCDESASGKLTIPSKIDGYPVTSIGSFAFYGCTGLTSITIPDSVTSIDWWTFTGCTGLKSVTIPDSVTYIGYEAFCGCTGLKSITIPDSVTYIGEDAFSGCTGLKSITIPDGVTHIGMFAFDCTGYYNNSSNWKNDVLYIGNHLIEAKTSIKGSYKIKSGTKCIADSAFVWCEKLTGITIPDSVTSIGGGAFGGCSSLTGITIPDSVTSIGSSAFYETGYYNNSSNWKNGVLYIGNHLIEANDSVKGSYKIESGTKCIADYAFLECTGLKSITVPGSVKFIGEEAFGYVIDYENDGDDPVIPTTKISGFKIYGYQKSAAQTYAKDNGCKFIDLATHKHSYTSKVTTKATTKKAGVKTYTCKCGDSYTKSIPKIKSITLSKDTFTYNGKTKKPTVTVKDSKGNTLKSGTDYTVKYSSGRKNVGKYTVTVTFKGKYSGAKKLTFRIKPKGTSISNLTAGKKQFTVKWKKQSTQTTGYQIQYSTSSKMTNPTTKTYANTGKTSLTVKNLKSAKKYYVRVRTYKNVKIDGKTYKYFSAWSNVKNVKTK